MKHIIIVKATLKLEEVSNDDVFVCKTFSHLVLFEIFAVLLFQSAVQSLVGFGLFYDIFAVGNINAETAEHLRGCKSHAGRMFCRRADGSMIF
jgi:hypothetical protein